MRFKQQATSFKRQAATFRALPCLGCCSILSSNNKHAKWSNKTSSMRAARQDPELAGDSTVIELMERSGDRDLTTPQIKYSSCKLRHFVARHYVPRDSSFKRQASSSEQQASSFKPRASSSRTLCPS